ISNFLDRCFARAASGLNTAHGVGLLKRFLAERDLWAPMLGYLDTLADTGGGVVHHLPQVPADPEAFFKKFQERKDKNFSLVAASLLTARPLAAEPTKRPKWLIQGVAVENQLGIYGGPDKSHKTSIALDEAVSLAYGAPAKFLGEFAVVGGPRRIG